MPAHELDAPERNNIRTVWEAIVPDKAMQLREERIHTCQKHTRETICGVCVDACRATHCVYQRDSQPDQLMLAGATRPSSGHRCFVHH